jgi:hypothetical protein
MTPGVGSGPNPKTDSERFPDSPQSESRQRARALRERPPRPRAARRTGVGTAVSSPRGASGNERSRSCARGSRSRNLRSAAPSCFNRSRASGSRIARSQAHCSPADRLALGWRPHREWPSLVVLGVHLACGVMRVSDSDEDDRRASASPRDCLAHSRPRFPVGFFPMIVSIRLDVGRPLRHFRPRAFLEPVVVKGTDVDHRSHFCATDSAYDGHVFAPRRGAERDIRRLKEPGRVLSIPSSGEVVERGRALAILVAIIVVISTRLQPERWSARWQRWQSVSRFACSWLPPTLHGEAAVDRTGGLLAAARCLAGVRGRDRVRAGRAHLDRVPTSAAANAPAVTARVCRPWLPSSTVSSA